MKQAANLAAGHEDMKAIVVRALKVSEAIRRL
jgi:hypothetical protein